MINFPSKFVMDTQPLTAGLFSPASGQAIQQLADRGYEVHVGLTPEFASAVSAMSLEPSIREYCPKDSTERFTDNQSTERWLAKRRSMFLLLKRSDGGKLVLAGYGWSGAEANQRVPGGQTTFALRIGEAGQGQDLATPFSQLILSASAALYGAKDVWLETWSSNGGAVHIYHKIGFVDVDQVPDKRPLPDGGSEDDIRIYMSLSNERLAKL